MPVKLRQNFGRKKFAIAIILAVVGIGGAGIFIAKSSKKVPKPGDLTAGEKVALVAEVLNTDEEGVPEELARARVAREQAAGGYYDEASGRMQDPSALFSTKGSSLDLTQVKEGQKDVSSQDLTPSPSRPGQQQLASSKPLFEGEKLGGFGAVEKGGLQFAKPGQLAFGKQRPQRPGQRGESGGSGGSGGGNIQWQQERGGRRDSSQVPLQVAKADVGKQSAKGMTEVGGGKKMAGSKKLAEEQQRVARGEGGTGLMGAIKRGITTMKSAFGIGAEAGTGESARFWHSGENAQQIASAGGQPIATIAGPGGNTPIDLGGDGSSGGGGGPTPGPGGPEGHFEGPPLPTVEDGDIQTFQPDENHCGYSVKVTACDVNIQHTGWDIGGDGWGSNDCHANKKGELIAGGFDPATGQWDPTIFTVYIYHYEDDSSYNPFYGTNDWTGYSRLQFRADCTDINGGSIDGSDIKDCDNANEACMLDMTKGLDDYVFKPCMTKCCMQPPKNKTTDECRQSCFEEAPLTKFLDLSAKPYGTCEKIRNPNSGGPFGGDAAGKVKDVLDDLFGGQSESEN